MPNSSFGSNKANLTQNVEIRPESIHIITEGRMEHLLSIAEQIKKYEKWEPRWDIVKNLISAFGAISLAGASLSASIWIGEISADPNLVYGIVVVSLGSAFGCLVAFIINCIRNKERKDQYSYQAEKIKDILKKVENTCIDRPKENGTISE